MQKERKYAALLLSKEYGSSIVWVMFFVPLLMAIAGYGVELTLHAIRDTQLSQAAEAASYAAARQLDGTRDGWLRAKRAALSAVKSSYILGAPDLSSLSFEDGAKGSLSDPLEPDSHFSENMAELEGFGLNLERGVYWVEDEGSRDPEFKSLEGKSSVLSLPLYAVANAARVSLHLESESLFGGLVGIKTIITETSSLAVFDDIQVDQVAPIAINACELLLDSNNVHGDWQTRSFEADKQCGREVTVMEANWNVPERLDGILRSDTHPRLSYKYDPLLEDNIIDHRKPFIRAVFGTPMQKGDNDSLSAEEMRKRLIYMLGEKKGEASSSWIRKATIGQRFIPMDNMEVKTGDFLDNTPLREAFRDWLNESSSKFKDEFGEVGNEKNSPRTNFPHLKVIREEFPNLPKTDIKGNVIDPRHKLMDLELRFPNLPTILSFPMGNLQPFPKDPENPWSDTFFTEKGEINPPQNVWTNPLCHDNSDEKAGYKGLPRNDPESGARRVRVLLIAPSIEDEATGDVSVKYCDYEGLYDSPSNPKHSAPLGSTKPRVIGTVWLTVFDFNFSDLSSFKDNVPGDFSPLSVPYEKTGCSYDNECSEDEVYRLLYYPMTFQEDKLCSAPIDPLSASESMGATFPYEDEKTWPMVWPLSIAQSFPHSEVSQHCLPGMISPKTCGDWNNPGCYEMRHRAVQYGCGAARARIDCADKPLSAVNTGPLKPRVVRYSK